DVHLGGLLGKELVRDLHQNAGAVAGARVGADGAAMLEVANELERVLDQLVRLLVLDVGEEADAAGIPLQRRIEQPLRRRKAGTPPRLAAPIFDDRPPAGLARNGSLVSGAHRRPLHVCRRSSLSGLIRRASAAGAAGAKSAPAQHRNLS